MKKIALFSLLLLLLCITACSSEIEEVDPTVLSPGEEQIDPEVTDPGQVIANQVVLKNSELYLLIKRTTQHTNNPMEDIVCIRFIYPLLIKKYDQNLTQIQIQNIQSDAAFYNFLVTLGPNEAISLSYPITALDENGQTFSITNNEQLKNMMKQCSQENVIGYCSGTFSDGADCYWRVAYEQGKDNRYAGGVFLIDQNHSLVFNFDGQEYPGNWIFLYAGNELHMNINLEGSSLVAAYWNIDRRINLSAVEIEIMTYPKSIKLEKYCGTNTVYVIGDIGPAGGTVFYDKGEYTNGWRYMEAAPEDFLDSEWGCAGSLIGAENSDIGSGKINSVAIANFHDGLNNYYGNPSLCNALNNGTVAAQKALLFETGGLKDWFLPSKEELVLLYENLHMSGLGNFSNAIYWSATETDAQNVKAIDFMDGAATLQPKTPGPNAIKTRAIRYF
jgi:hypothetical protein